MGKHSDTNSFQIGKDSFDSPPRFDGSPPSRGEFLIGGRRHVVETVADVALGDPVIEPVAPDDASSQWPMEPPSQHLL